MFDLKDKLNGAVTAMACAAAAAAAGVAALFFFCVAIFVWTQHQYGTVTAALVLAIVFLSAAIAALTIGFISRRQVEGRQQNQRKSDLQGWADPVVITAALEVFRSIGSKRLITVLLGALVVGTLLSQPSAQQNSPTRSRGSAPQKPSTD
jgi:uncharacterized sodium:solute symporter family permease YidK